VLISAFRASKFAASEMITPCSSFISFATLATAVTSKAEASSMRSSKTLRAAEMVRSATAIELREPEY
jgi:hypothetical protein